MKARISIESVRTDAINVEGVEVNFDYTVEELLAVVAAYPELIKSLVKDMNHGNS